MTRTFRLAARGPFSLAVALAYRLPASPSGADLQKLKQNGRPYRTWVTLLLRAQLEDETGEIRGNT